MTPAIIEDTIAPTSLAQHRLDVVGPKAPRVLQLLDTAQFAGTERLVLSLTDGLGRAGASVVLGCRGDSPLYHAAIERGLDVEPLFDRGLLPTGPSLEPRLPQLRSVLKTVRQRSIDIVHAHNGRTTLVAAVAARVTGVTAVASQHFVHPASAGYRGPKRLLAGAAHRWVNRQLGSVVAVSSAARSEMIRRVGFPANRIVHIPNGIEPPLMPGRDKVAAIRDELNVPPGAPLIVTVARLADEKGLDVWVDAVARIHDVRPDARFVIVGHGPQKQAILARMAERRVTQILTLAGFRTDATDWIAAGDLFVLPSPAEPFGLVLLEAMALGKPVVACGAAGPLDIVTNDVDGMLVAPGSATALSDAVLRLLADTRYAGRIAAAGRATFSERFTADRMALEVLDVYASAQSARRDQEREQ
jgi:glycosyltransferase involved in cell wall biosynthesis